VGPSKWDPTATPSRSLCEGEIIDFLTVISRRVLLPLARAARDPTSTRGFTVMRAGLRAGGAGSDCPSFRRRARRLRRSRCEHRCVRSTVCNLWCGDFAPEPPAVAEASTLVATTREGFSTRLHRLLLLQPRAQAPYRPWQLPIATRRVTNENPSTRSFEGRNPDRKG
jgi:hypothetical protein